MNFRECVFNVLYQVVGWETAFSSIIPLCIGNRAASDFLATDFETDWNTAHLPMVELVAWVLEIAIVNCSSDSSQFQFLLLFVSEVQYVILIVFGFDDWNDDDLLLGDLWWKDEALIIRVHHNHCTNTPSREAP